MSTCHLVLAYVDAFAQEMIVMMATVLMAMATLPMVMVSAMVILVREALRQVGLLCQH